MMIRDMFADDINRKINGVIKVDQAADDVIEQELNEYVITRELKKHFITFFNYYGDAFDQPTADMGVWISGFFGSGKSHFLKMLSYLLENKEVKGIRSVERFRKKFEDDPATFMLIDRATKEPTETILFNIDIEGFSNKDKTAVLRVFAKMFYNHLGFYGENLKVAMMERYIDQQGKTEEFRRVFEEKKGKPWLEMRRAFAFNGKFIIPTLMEVLDMSEDDAKAWFNDKTATEISIAQLVEDMKAYVDTKPANFRLLFMIDEVGQYVGTDTDMLLNLQSLTEKIGSECEGKIWVICTGQEAIDEIIKVRADEFSRIQARFKTKEYGSILTVTPQDWSALYDRFAEITDDINMSRETALRELLPLVQVAEALAQKYDVVVTNPPYMGASNMNPKLNEFIKNNYADYKSDFFSAFVIHASQMTKQSGYCGFFTPYVWMFISAYEKMRNYLYNRTTVETLIQFEYSAFEEATVPVCTFAFQNRHVQKKGCYLRLVDFRGGMEVQRQKTLEAIENHDCGFYYEQSTDNFSKIPGSPVAYWASAKLFDTFASFATIGDYYDVRNGITTGDNNTFLKLWHEIGENPERWFPCNKGGAYRKWYGNKEYVVDWANDGQRLKTNVDKNGKIRATLRGIDFNFTEGITMSRVTSGLPSFREMSSDSISESATNAIYPKSRDKKDSMKLLALMNSKIGSYILPLLNPTINVVPEDIRSIPIKMELLTNVSGLAETNCILAKEDWDSFETSWDFLHHPLLRKVYTIAESFDQWQAECDERFNQLKANEEELNRIFIDIYGLQEELTPEVEDKDVTVRKADLGRDIRSFISYAVGCMFGRYSLDVDGLAYAGGEWDASKYASFAADKDNIIPICDDEYFEDDIVGLFVEFVKTVYGADTLDENLKFIADALGGKGQPKDVIRNYFLNDFYKDHCKIYQKRPIYWLFDSGKKNGFKALIYMHRYQPDTIARIRTDYVHEQQARYRTAIADLEQRIANTSTGERVKLNKKLTTLQAQDTEIRTYEEKIHHLADQMISIDLDDGVKKNYAIFQDVLAKIK